MTHSQETQKETKQKRTLSAIDFFLSPNNRERIFFLFIAPLMLLLFKIAERNPELQPVTCAFFIFCIYIFLPTAKKELSFIIGWFILPFIPLYFT